MRWGLQSRSMKAITLVKMRDQLGEAARPKEFLAREVELARTACPFPTNILR